MPYVRKFKTDAELAEFRSMIARNRKNNNGGRPKGSKNKAPSMRTVTRTLTIREADFAVFSRCAYAANVPLIEFMHLNAEGLRRRNPEVFGPITPIEP